MSDELGGEKNFINNVIMTVTQPGYNLQSRYKMRTRSGIWSLTEFFEFYDKWLTYAEHKFGLNAKRKSML